jgi:hypothetical protein
MVDLVLLLFCSGLSHPVTLFATLWWCNSIFFSDTTLVLVHSFLATVLYSIMAQPTVSYPLPQVPTQFLPFLSAIWGWLLFCGLIWLTKQRGEGQEAAITMLASHLLFFVSIWHTQHVVAASASLAMCIVAARRQWNWWGIQYAWAHLVYSVLILVHALGADLHSLAWRWWLSQGVAALERVAPQACWPLMFVTAFQVPCVVVALVRHWPRAFVLACGAAALCAYGFVQRAAALPVVLAAVGGLGVGIVLACQRRPPRQRQYKCCVCLSKCEAQDLAQYGCGHRVVCTGCHTRMPQPLVCPLCKQNTQRVFMADASSSS